MQKEYRKAISFQAGEISPKFYGRSDTEIYQKGLETAKNVFIDKRGGAFRRAGLEHIAQGDGDYARVFTKQIDRFRFDSIFLTDGLLTIYAPGGNFLTPNLVSNARFDLAGTDWTVETSPALSNVAFTGGVCNLNPAQVEPQIVTEPNFEQGGANWPVVVVGAASTVVFQTNQCRLTAGPPVGNSAAISQSLTSNSPGLEHRLRLTANLYGFNVSIKIGTAVDLGEYYDQVLTSVPAEIFFTPAASPFVITISTATISEFIDINSVFVDDPIARIAGISQEVTATELPTEAHYLVVNQTAKQPLTIKVGTSAHLGDIATFKASNLSLDLVFIPNQTTYWVSVEASGVDVVQSTLTFVGSVATSAIGGGEGGFPQAAPWTQEQLPEVHMIESPDGEAMYFVHPRVAVHKVTYTYATNSYGAVELVVFTMPPLLPNDSEVWDGVNFPSTGTIFQGRFWLAGTPNQPQTIWASKSGSPEDFTVVADEDSSSMEFTLQKFGQIQWLFGTKQLLVGTINGEHIFSSDGPVITPTDFGIEQQSSYGSNDMQAIQIGEKIFYVTPDGFRLRAMAYEWQEDNWLSQDLTFASEHITAGRLRNASWAQNPNSILNLVMEDGTGCFMTYDRTAQTIGWTNVVLDGFKLFDIATGTVNGTNHFVVVGQRVSGEGLTKLTAGKVDLEISSGGSRLYLDSHATFFSDIPGNLLTGLDHLEGLTVQVVVDGAVDDEQVVVNGQITTTIAGKELSAGIKIHSLIKTLPPDVPDTLDSIRSWKKRWGKLWALLLNSNVPIINGKRPPDRDPSTPMNTPQPPRTGHVKTTTLGWDDFGQVTIEEDQPVPMNILAIYGEMGKDTL